MKTFPEGPRPVVVSGAPLHGKTSVAEALAAGHNWWLIDPDAFRHAAFPRKQSLQGIGERLVMNLCYKFAVDAAELTLTAGDAVVLPATFSTDTFKRPLIELWYRMNQFIPINIFRLEVPEPGREAVIEQRIESRRVAGKPATITDIQKYRWARTLPTPWPEGVPVIEIDASQNLEQVCNDIAQSL